MINWILCPVHNGLALTQKAVNTFLRQDYGLVRVLLIDNASTDGTNEWARSMYPRVVTLRKDPPLSVAQSWNKGLTGLFGDSTVNQVLVCNNDVELRVDTYRQLLSDRGGFVTAVGNQDPECIKVVTPPTAAPRPHPDFSCFLIDRATWQLVGKFDEQFLGAFCEDWDYHVRLHKAGVYAHCIDLPFYHVGSATINNMSPADRDRLCKQADLNRAYFKEKWGVAGGSPEYYALFSSQTDDAH